MATARDTLSLDNVLLKPGESKSRTALVADADPTHHSSIENILSSQGFAIISAYDGVQALELYEEHNPDIILIDIELPQLDGIETIKRIKALGQLRYVPVIFLSAAQDDDVLNQCLAAGGDDFLTKPFKPSMLRSKLIALGRTQSMYKELEDLHGHMQRDQAIAERVFSSAVLSNNYQYPNLRTLHKPASIFSGDVTLTALRPNGDLNIMLGDFTGHGLAAAIGSLPLSETFQAMTAKGYSGPEILQQVGKKLSSMLPTGIFLSCCFVNVSHENKQIYVWNGGLPDLWLLNSKGIKKRFPSIHPPLGIFPPKPNDILFDMEALDEDDTLLIVSDGILEARNPKGEYFGEERLFEAATQGFSAHNIIEALNHQVQHFCDGRAFDDDVSIVEVPLGNPNLPDTHQHEEEDTQVTYHQPSSWEWNIKLEQHSLAQVDPVPLAMRQLQEMVNPLNDSAAVFTALTELCQNGLDHGVLKLSSAYKNSAEGFEHYFKDKEERLQHLTDGHLILRIAFSHDDTATKLSIEIEDSGTGFNFADYLGTTTENRDNALHGRGIQLLKGLCTELSYQSPGNIAQALFEWSANGELIKRNAQH